MVADHPDHCATLGVKRGASNEELHAAYRRLALLHHPDRNRGNEEVATARFQEVQRAFEALRDTDERLAHSASESAQSDTTTTTTPGTKSSGGDPFAWFDASWGPSFSRKWNESAERREASSTFGATDWFDEKSWRSRSSSSTSQHPGFGVFGRLFTQLPPMPPLETRVERNRRGNNWRETRRSFRLFREI
ncbi:hypothetical protein SAMD00023353_9900120 [Rosellinia necatrix]|uniref:J domain-containing protein n=1 Tax=Rosellinia necatrix TaxID=77044 RepID=A0A1W2TWI8_ROSNE|nr:hypothetical protein SAMD00023353_9900120 [Rosellinia necatrix]